MLFDDHMGVTSNLRLFRKKPVRAHTIPLHLRPPFGAMRCMTIKVEGAKHHTSAGVQTASKLGG